MASQTDRGGAHQTPAPDGVSYATPELHPQGVLASNSPRGAALFIVFTSPQRPLYGTGATSGSLPSSRELVPAQGPIDRGW